MKLLRSRRGAGLVDVITTVCILGITGVVFSTTFPTSYSSIRQSEEYKIATAIAQRKMEQLRATRYESLTYTLLRSAGTIDVDPTVSPYSFTAVDNVGSVGNTNGQLPSATGSLTVTDVSTYTRKVQVTVSWSHGDGTPQRSVVLTTVFADKRTRRAT